MPINILNELAPYNPHGAGQVTVGGNQRGKLRTQKRVLRVSTLADYDENETAIQNSLRWCVEQQGERIVVFDVCGEITLKRPLNIVNGNITIDGSSAPGLGVCIRDYTTNVLVDEVILRHLRFRLGDSASDPKGDCVHIENCSKVVLDHLSLSWSIDELLGVQNVDKLLVQWCIFSEALSNSFHPPNDDGSVEHSKGSLLTLGTGSAAASTHRMSLHHNIFAHNVDRNPRIGSGVFDIRYNVFYNYGKSNAGATSENAPADFNYIGNYLKPGPDSEGNYFFEISNANVQGYVQGNIIFTDGTGTPNDDTGNVDNTNRIRLDAGVSSNVLTSTEIRYKNLPTAPTSLSVIFNFAGARRPQRDPVDTRIINDVINGTGGIINSPSDVGGYPNYSATMVEMMEA